VNSFTDKAQRSADRVDAMLKLREEQNQKWWANVAVIRAKVQQILRDTWPDIPDRDYPTDIECQPLAQAIQILMATKGKRQQKHRKTPLQSAADKFLSELAKEYAELEDSVPEENRQHYKDEFERIDRAKAAASVFLERRTPLNPTSAIERHLIEAWSARFTVEYGGREGQRTERAVRRQPPRPLGKNRDGKLTEAVTKLLALAGVNYSLDSVSEMLRGIWTRPR
jgi:hypothetical protein